MKTLQLHAEDDVAIALLPLANGQVSNDGLVVLDDIPAMHKVAVRNIAAGELILKFNQPIGKARCDIAVGRHVHSHNCEFAEVNHDTRAASRAHGPMDSAVSAMRFFDGYRREDGRAGTRNYIGIVTSVNCSATVARQIAAEFDRSDSISRFPNIDGVVAITHGSGCGMQSAGDGFDLLRRTLDGYISHPNFGGVLVVGLGCEVMQLESLVVHDSVRKLSIQSVGGTKAAIKQGLDIVNELAGHANACSREALPAAELTLALQCGGSDAYSGITANPALGVAADLIVEQGGRAILSETPEIYGAEHLLIERAASSDVAEALSERIDWWRQYAERNGDTLNSNPSPGNLAGGITTILEKSLGAQAKSGSSSLNAVIRYAERADAAGLNFMDSPGFDPASVTGQVAAGANVICFTTGRGSAFGFKPVPSIKLATNTSLFDKMSDDMDINCGTVADQRESVSECGKRIFSEILSVASGRPSRSEELGYGDNEFTPWQLGAVY